MTSYLSEMVKEHNVRINIDNQSGKEMAFANDWFDSGRLADENPQWPQKIGSGENATILCYERDWAVAGCSGHVTYTMGGTPVTIAFSNPLVGCNKLGVGADGQNVWELMDNHGYQPFVIYLVLADNTTLTFKCQCTGGEINSCEVKIVCQ